MRLLLILFSLTGFFQAFSQKVLQIEKYGSPKTKKLYIGDEITYKIKGDDIWHINYIDDLIIDRNIIALEDRYVKLEDIDAFRYNRGWAQPASISLYTFGGAWSGFALIGTLTDGDPSTNYRASDAIVSAVSIGLGFVVGKFLRHKTIQFGKRRRLRMLDLSFKKPGTR